MNWPYAVLIVLSPAILYGFALATTALISAHYRRVCPKCQRRGLKCVNFIKATVLVEGRRTPALWSYYLCELCEAGFKLERDEWIEVEASEIRRYSQKAKALTVVTKSYRNALSIQLDHENLTCSFAGLDFWPTGLHGRAVKEIMA